MVSSVITLSTASSTRPERSDGATTVAKPSSAVSKDADVAPLAEPGTFGMVGKYTGDDRNIRSGEFTIGTIVGWLRPDAAVHRYRHFRYP